MDSKEMASIVVGAGAGAAQTFVLREYVDKERGIVVDSLKNFGTASAMAGIGGGGVAAALGIYSVMTGAITRDPVIQAGLVSYGASALIGGVISGLRPVSATATSLRRVTATRRPTRLARGTTSSPAGVSSVGRGTL